MSLALKATWAPAPSTARGQPTPIDCDPNGERLIYANGKSIFIRSIDTPSSCTQYTGHNSPTAVARFSPSGYYVASGDSSGQVRVWDATKSPTDPEQPATKGEYSIISGRINDLSWDGDSQRIIAVGDGKNRYGHAFTADSGNSVGEISGHSKQINCVSIRQQRPLRAVTGSDDSSLAFYHGAPFKYSAGIQGRHGKYVFGSAFSPDGTRFVSVGADSKIWAFDGKTGEEQKEIGQGAGSHKGSIFAVSWSHDSKRFVTVGADGAVKIWDVESGELVEGWQLASAGDAVQQQQVGVVWVRARKSPELIVACSLAGDLTYLQPGEKVLRVIRSQQSAPTAMTLVHSGPPCLATGAVDGTVALRDISSSDAQPLIGEAHSSKVIGLTRADSLGLLLSVGWDDTIRTFSSSQHDKPTPPIEISSQPAAALLIGPSLLLATAEPSLDLYTISDMKLSYKSKLSYTPTALSQAPGQSADLAQLAVGSSDNITRIYDGYSSTMKETHALKGSRAAVTALCFSSVAPNLLAVADASGKISVFDPTQEYKLVIDRWGGHSARITGIAWDKAGTHAVSCGLDTHIFLWSVKSPGKRVKILNAHKEGISSILWIDEQQVASAGADGAVKIWQVGNLD